MKRILWAIVLLFHIQLAFGDTNADYEYTFTNNDKEIAISQCNLDQNIIDIPSTISANGKTYPVTTIKGLIAEYSKPNTVYVHIPASVTKLTPISNHITNGQTNTALKSIIIENGDFRLTNKNVPFYFYTANTNHLDNIIVFGSCPYTSEELTGRESHNVFKAGLIKILLKNGSSLSIQMYLCNSIAKERYTHVFDHNRLEYLKTALEVHGTNIDDVQVIDFSELFAEKQFSSFEFESYSDLFPNATIITIADKADYSAPTQDISTFISYQRTNTQYWNSVCLPFAIKESDFPEGTSIYCLKEIKDNKVYLSRIEDGASVPAGVPCYIYCDSNTPWDIQIANGTIAANQAPIDQESDGWKLVGSFVNQPLGTGKYKLNSAGDAFVTTTQSSTVTAFRCYLAPVNSSTAPARLEVGVDEEAEITLVPDDREPQRMKLYDLMGRPRRENAPGLFIRGK